MWPFHLNLIILQYERYDPFAFMGELYIFAITKKKKLKIKKQNNKVEEEL